ncbi:uncharacterized protein [Temnothorax longispinosus]|uniref:uncharacterized protein isoform X2 n=1 Tax=Temnothorax longispinosus TaxID=300112 RepID=UPI003A9A402E
MEFISIFEQKITLIYDEKIDAFIRKIDVARSVGRALAHQCWENPVSFSSLSQHMCLKEGILTLYVADAINKIYPEFRIWDLFVVQIHQESLRLDTHSFMSEASSTEINSPLPFSCYIKGPAILRMLQHALSEEIFWNGIKVFLNHKVRKSPLNFDDLWTAMQIALNNSTGIYKFNIKDMMNDELGHN